MTKPSRAVCQLVIERAGDRCEYCGLAQMGQEAKFHIDHIVPQAAGGPTDAENLALACVSCSLRKGARQNVPDPESGQEVPLFHPRQDKWNEHFSWDDLRIQGRTPSGRATAEALKMNRSFILGIRYEEQCRGRHPSPETD